MSQHGQPGEATPQRSTTVEDGPAVEPLASIVEYAKRLDARYTWMLQQLARLRERPERWIVAGPARVECWHVGAIAIGPPGLFLLWPEATRPEPAFWPNARECRAHVQRCLGERSHAGVEIVLYSPSEKRGRMQRCIDTEDDVLIAVGNDLDRLLSEWEPVSGVRLSEQWLSWMETASAPREWLYGPDKNAHQQHPHWSAIPPSLADHPDR